MTTKDPDLQDAHEAAEQPEAAETPTPVKRKSRPRSAKTTRENILRAAKKIFAKDGYGGARVEKISKAAKSYDSLIYYYFGSKEKLFVEVLESAYKDIFEAEQNLELDAGDPVGSLRTIIEFPFRYYMENPELIVLLGTENLQKGKHISKSSTADQYALPAIAILEQVIKNGQQMGHFRPDIDSQKLYIAMTALGYFYVSNRFTFSAFLKTDLMDADRTEEWARYISDLMLQSVLIKP